ncbi:MAG: putative baseplate assembly protein [Dehalococcoidales bacterium]|nr:MAG: putative baseplate assembly protein [Dehalococcoidales bacterium]
MSLQTPNLDDRRFQDIVSEARSKIPLYCPNWTDYNLSDPGITLIEMFAWMVDMLLYRMNRVPEKTYIKFMDMIGVRLEPPKPAKVNVTFRLSAAQPEQVTIPQGTEIATVRTETQDAISFTTDCGFSILIPGLSYALTAVDDNEFSDIFTALNHPDRMVSVFQEVPQENDALYLGYAEDLASHTLLLNFQSTVEGIGVNPQDPPWSWEYWDGDYEKWSPMKLEEDTTGGLNTNGQVIVHIPDSSAMREVNGLFACWIRCRAVQPRSDQSGYSSSPKVRSIISESIGCTVSASQSFKTTDELLGRSKGTPGQEFQLHNIPVLTLAQGETIVIETENEGEYESWQAVADFADSGPDDRHFTLDNITGQISFGPSMKQPTGEERQYGKIPPADRLIRFSSYRSGGGIIGNVGEGTIKVLKSSIPYIDSVKNFERARDGTDAETLEMAKLRVPHILRTNTRAVTREDFEYLAIQASSKIARAKSISPGDTTDNTLSPGTMRVLLVPTVTEFDGYIPPEQLEITKKVREEVSDYLDERRLLGTRLELGEPEYLYVSVEVHVRTRRGYQQQASEDVETRLYEYVNPICGGADGTGWSFGRSLIPSEIHACLQNIENVDYIEEVKIYPVDPDTGEKQDAVSRINVPYDGLLCSYNHEVIIAD